MKVYSFKSYFTTLALACLIPAVNAQFDDVYYDPDNVAIRNYGDESSYNEEYTEEVTYYDDDSYEYYDDYDYYYSSRIRRFHRPYSGFDFYDPCYVSYNYYDPYDYNAYYYPGASIYINFGHDDYWSYRNWRRWNRYNHWNNYYSWNSWCLTPSYYYYSYNNWCSPNHNYWGGYHGYYSYSNYYNNYYNSCPFPVSGYYGINHGTVTTVNNNGNTRGTYYGPRITGNTGSSPRGPVGKPENVQPVFKESEEGKVTQSNGLPRVNDTSAKPGTRSNPLDVEQGTISTGTPTTREEATNKVIVDKELKREDAISRRPVFKPYPSNDPKPDPTTTSKVSPDSRDSYSPQSNDRSDDTPVRDENKPQYQPSPRSTERPSYTPREEEKPTYTPRNDSRPSYTPPSRNNDRSDDRPSYTPPSRNTERSDDKPSYTPSRNNDRSDDRPSYNPPSHNDSSSGSRSSSPPPSRDNSSSNSSRSNSNNSSPRSPGRG